MKDDEKFLAINFSCT